MRPDAVPDGTNDPVYENVRPWVRRLGSYLRIFGPPASGTMGYRTSGPWLDSLIEQAKRREAEVADRKRRAGGAA